MVDKRALYSIGAGVYLFTALDGERGVGRVVDAVSQVAAEPKRVSVSLMKGGWTSQVMAKAGVGGRFVLTTLAVDAPMALIEAFGYQSSEVADKFAGCAVQRDGADVPYTAEGAVARMSCEVFAMLDMGSHWLLLADVVEAEVLSGDEPMTYAGYRKLKAQAKTTKEAAAPAKRIGWQCSICGYIIECESLPDDFTCPRCGVGRDLFERIEL